MFDRVGRAGYVVVDEGAEHEHDCVDLTDIGEKLIAETFTLACAFYETSNVDDLDCGMNGVLRC